MIIEDFVNESVAGYLKESGYEIVSQALGKRSGPDIHAKDSKCILKIECKGETQAKNQANATWESCARALFNLLKKIENREPNVIWGLAFPDTEHYRRRMESLESFCKRHFIPVFWVKSNGAVREWNS